MKRWQGGLIASMLMVVSACGSTVQTTGAEGIDALGAAPGSDLGSLGSPGALPGAAGPGGTAAGGGLGVPGVGATGSGTQAGVPGAPGTVPGGPGGTTPSIGSKGPIPESGPGWDAKTVKIGVMTQKDVQSVAAGFNLNNVDSGDQEGVVRAVVADLNSRGGLLGRQIVVEFHDVATAGNAESEGQAACSHFTDDVRVVAVYAMALAGDVASFRSCMREAGVPVFAAGGQAFDDPVFEELDGFYNLMTFPSWSRFAGPFVQRLKAQGYFTGWNTQTGAPGSAPVKTGLICPDTPVGKRVGEVLGDALGDVGYAPTAEYYFTGTDQNNAVVRFRTDGVTHVFYCDLTMFLFTQSADSQGYRPRYGISSFNTPILFLQGTASNAQLAGSMGVGFAPTLDVDAANDPGDAGPAGEAACRAAAAKEGIEYAPTKRLAQGILYDTCDVFRLIVDSAVAANSLEGTGIVQGVSVAGSKLVSAYTWRSGFSADNRANPNAVRDLYFDSSCNCYRYRGPLSGIN